MHLSQEIEKYLLIVKVTDSRRESTVASASTSSALLFPTNKDWLSSTRFNVKLCVLQRVSSQYCCGSFKLLQTYTNIPAPLSKPFSKLYQTYLSHEKLIVLSKRQQRETSI